MDFPTEYGQLSIKPDGHRSTLCCGTVVFAERPDDGDGAMNEPDPTIARELIAVISSEIEAQAGVRRDVSEMAPLIADAVIDYFDASLKVQRETGGVGNRETPTFLSLVEAYRAMFVLVDQYVALESEPDEGLVLFHQYLLSDPARWEDWESAVRRATGSLSSADPLIENLPRREE